MNYFVTVDGITISTGLSKNKAIEIAKKEVDKTKCGLSVGIGKYKLINGKMAYTLFPSFFYE